MDNKIYKKNGNLVIEIPLKSQRRNPYNESFKEEMDNIIGVIAGDEFGFAYIIDRAYKDKGDDFTDIFFHYYKSEDNFVKLCKKLEIEVVKYPICSNCNKVIYGCFTLGNNGNLCFECEKDI